MVGGAGGGFCDEDSVFVIAMGPRNDWTPPGVRAVYLVGDDLDQKVAVAGSVEFAEENALPGA